MLYLHLCWCLCHYRATHAQTLRMANSIEEEAARTTALRESLQQQSAALRTDNAQLRTANNDCVASIKRLQQELAEAAARVRFAGGLDESRGGFD